MANFCNFCKPKKIDWEESGFYGYVCDTCKIGITAFIALKEHRSDLTKDEKKTFNMLRQKYYSDFVSYELSSRGYPMSHFYEMFKKE